jgi:ATP-dependent Clp protease protease subunit
MRQRLNEILVEHTGQTFDRIQTDTDRDYILSAEQARDYGIIDDVLSKRG